MNKDLLNFFKAHEEKVLKFNLELRNLEELLRSKTKRVAENVKCPDGSCNQPDPKHNPKI